MYRNELEKLSHEQLVNIILEIKDFLHEQTMKADLDTIENQMRQESAGWFNFFDVIQPTISVPMHLISKRINDIILSEIKPERNQSLDNQDCTQ
jgi:hypothetical protein